MKVTSRQVEKFVKDADPLNKFAISQILRARFESLNLGSLLSEIRYLTKEVHDFEAKVHFMSSEEFGEMKYDYYSKKKRLEEKETELFDILDADKDVEYELTPEQIQILTDCNCI